MDKDAIKVAAIISGAVLTGAGIAVFATRDHYRLKYEEQLEEEIRSVKDAFSRESKEGVYATPEQALKVLHPEVPEHEERVTVINQYLNLQKEEGYVMVEGERYEAGGDEPDEEDLAVPVQARNVFEESSRLPERKEGYPYVISVDEYMNEEDYSKVSLAYYEEDGVLADEREAVVPNIHQVIGDGTDYFGVASGDPLIVYVKNDRLQTVFEIVRDPQSYAKLVLRINEAENSPIRRRMRPTDD